MARNATKALRTHTRVAEWWRKVIFCGVTERARSLHLSSPACCRGIGDDHPEEITGMALELNHLTLSVRDLGRSILFYTDVAGLRLEASWSRGAYLTAGATWICLSLDENTRTEIPAEYTHIAFGCSAAEFASRVDRVRRSGAQIWKENRSEGESLYFLDPDGHKLELHIGDLRTRLQACRAKPYDGMTFHSAGVPVDSLADGLTVHIDHSPPAHDCASIIEGLIFHTERESQIQRRDSAPLSVFIRDSQQGIVAGLNGVTIWGWLHVKELWVHTELRRRGLGRRIMSAAESAAMERGCRHAFLDTFDFQAKPFYERLGYRQWGELRDFPPGHMRFFMAKSFERM